MDRNLVTTKYPTISQTNISVWVEWIWHYTNDVMRSNAHGEENPNFSEGLSSVNRLSIEPHERWLHRSIAQMFQFPSLEFPTHSTARWRRTSQPSLRCMAHVKCDIDSSRIIIKHRYQCQSLVHFNYINKPIQNKIFTILVRFIPIK